MEDVFFSVGNYLQNLYTSRISALPFSISLSLFIILVCLLGIAELLVFILTGRVALFIKKKRNADLKNRIISMLANVLVFSDSDNPKAVAAHFRPRFSKIPLYRGSIRRLLVSEILNNHSNFSGRAAEILRELYLQLKLDKAARKNLNSRHWDKQIEAIRELTEMSVKDECERIFKYTNSRNPHLRIEAQISYIKLCMDNPFRFFDHIREPILEWHQMVLFEVITKTETMARPRFLQWLNSSNDSLVALCLKLIEFYQQFDAQPYLIYLINHANLSIRAAAIEILGRMEAEMAESHFISAYPYQPQKIKVKILNALGSISSGKSLNFLNSQADSKEFPVKIAAIRAIKAHRQEGRRVLTALLNEVAAPDKAIIKHVLDERVRV